MSKYITLNQKNGDIYINTSVAGVEFEGFTIDYKAYGGINRLSVTLVNSATGEKINIVSRDPDTFTRKADSKVEKWLKNQAREQGKETAKAKTLEAENNINWASNILNKVLEKNLKFEPKDFYKDENFDESPPIEPTYKRSVEIPKKPRKSSFKVDISFFDNIFISSKRDKIRRYKNSYRKALQNWEKNKSLALENNASINKQNKLKKEDWNQSLLEWKKQKESFYETIEKRNEQVDKLFEKSELSKDETERYFTLVLKEFDHLLPEFINSEYDLEYRNNTLILNYYLPTIEDLPTLEKVTYVISRGEYKEKHISKTKTKNLYDNLCYGLVISIIEVVFSNDRNNNLKAISLNGLVNTRNKKTGKQETNTILSIQVEKEEFSQLDLNHVEPKDCFKGLKGLSSTKLIEMVPVKPIMRINKEDSRFIESQEVIDGLDATKNLAAMDWQEFEYLIREIFEKEFSQNGGEVNVTQSSRDQGVDAIAFDPDPIKGGKIVIQAKRYTNTVGVANVRDLYGTVINEGANRGLLITTSDYGPESHNFVKDKPISLINGQEMLYLLKKHGYSAKIDINEAKKIISEREEKLR